MLSIVDIRKRFGEVQALGGCSFSVERGRMLGFLGPKCGRQDDDDARGLRARGARWRRGVCTTALQGALSKTPTYRVAVVAPVPTGLTAALQRAAKPFDDAKVLVRAVADRPLHLASSDPGLEFALLAFPGDHVLAREVTGSADRLEHARRRFVVRMTCEHRTCPASARA